MAKTDALYYPTANGGAFNLGYGVPYDDTVSIESIGPEKKWGKELLRPCLGCIQTLATDIKNGKYKSLNDIATTNNLKNLFDKINNFCVKPVFLHPGVDLQANQNESVYSAAWGQIVNISQAIESKGFNFVIKIHHKITCKTNGKDIEFWASYAHLDGNKLTKKYKVNDYVDAGQPLARGTYDQIPKNNTGGDHLHFEIHTKPDIKFKNWPALSNTYVNLFYYIIAAMNALPETNSKFVTQIQEIINGNMSVDLAKANFNSKSANSSANTIYNLLTGTKAPNTPGSLNRYFLDAAFIDNDRSINSHFAFTTLSALSSILYKPSFAQPIIGDLKTANTFETIRSQASAKPVPAQLPSGYTDPLNFLQEISNNLKIELSVPYT